METISVFTANITSKKLLVKKSLFLFGPRSTGKTCIIRKQLADSVIIIDLLRTDTYFLLQSKPWELENIIDAQFSKNKNIVVIDKIHIDSDQHR